MIRLLLALALALTAAAPAAFADSGPRRLLTADEAEAWQAVGRLNIQGGGFCTGALVADDLVLTAAHCLFFKRTGKPVPPERVHFLAGWRKGRAAAHRQARRIMVHPDYEFGAADKLDRVATDIALIELETPIRDSVIRPFARDKSPAPGDEVAIVSYARDRAEAPSLEEGCELLGRQSEVLVLSCDVNFGASGAPIFIHRGGQPRIASVVSAMARWEDRDVALGTALGASLDGLMRALRGRDPVFTPRLPGEALPQVGQAGGGRKVVTPPTGQ